MALVIGSLVAGFGLFVFGLHFLTENLKLLSGRKLRRRIAASTRRPIYGVLWGGVLKIVTQSAAATTFILVSMVRSGMISVPQALPIIVGSNVLSSVTLLVLVLDANLAVLFLLGVAGIVYASDRAVAWRTIAGAVLGVGLLFFGLHLMQEAVAPLTRSTWFEDALALTHGSYLLGLAVGAALSFVVQSTLAVIVLTIALEAAGLFSLDEAIMVVYGANLGSSLLVLALSTSVSGHSKQVAMYQMSWNLVGAMILIPAFYVEVFGGVPLVGAFVEALFEEGEEQLAIVYLIYKAVPALVLLALIRPSARLLARAWPESAQEQASKPKYLHEHAADDPDCALDLIELELARQVEFLSAALGSQREVRSDGNLAAARDAFKTLGLAIREAISGLPTRMRLSSESYERLDRLLEIQNDLEAGNETIRLLAQELTGLRSSEAGHRFASAVVEGLDAVALTVLDVARERDQQDAAMLSSMSAEDGRGIREVRAAYLAEEGALDDAQRLQLLAAANHSERLIWLFGKIGRDYMALSAM